MTAPPSIKPSRNVLVIELVAIAIAMYVIWCVTAFTREYYPRYLAALEEDERVMATIDVPPTHTDWGCMQCSVMPMSNDTLYSCMECSVPVASTPDYRSRVIAPLATRRRLVNEYYDRRTWLMSGDLCTLGDSHFCPTVIHDLILMVMVLETPRMHPVEIIGPSMFLNLAGLAVWLVMRYKRRCQEVVQDARRAEIQVKLDAETKALDASLRTDIFDMNTPAFGLRQRNV